MRISTDGNVEDGDDHISSALANIEEVLTENAVKDAVNLKPPVVDERCQRTGDHTAECLRTIGVEQVRDRDEHLVEVAVRVGDSLVLLELLNGGLKLDREVGQPEEAVVNDINNGVDAAEHGSGAEGAAVLGAGAVDDTVNEPLHPGELLGKIEADLRHARHALGKVHANLVGGVETMQDTCALVCTLLGEHVHVVGVDVVLVHPPVTSDVCLNKGEESDQ